MLIRQFRDRGARPPVDPHRRRDGRCRRGRRSAPGRRHLPRRRPRADLRITPRRRDPPPQRLRLGRSRARRADRRAHVIGAGRRARATSTARSATARRSTSGRSGSRCPTRRATRRSTSPTPSPTRSRRGPAAPVQRRLAARRRGRPDGPPRRGARACLRPRDAPLAPRCRPAPTTTHVAVHPTHGAGSLCATGIALDADDDDRLRAPPQPAPPGADVEAFATRLLRGQPAVPRYFARMRPTNQAGPALLGGRVPEPRPLSLEETRARLAAGALLLDLRPPADHSVAHAPARSRSRSAPSFGTWLGWVVEPDRPLVLVLERAPTGTTRSARRSGSVRRARSSATSGAGSGRGPTAAARSSRPAA